jgi:hypothetical protein
MKWWIIQPGKLSQSVGVGSVVMGLWCAEGSHHQHSEQRDIKLEQRLDKSCHLAKSAIALIF